MATPARFVTSWIPAVAVLALAACAGRVSPAAGPVAAAPTEPIPSFVVATPVSPIRDMVGEIIATSDEHFTNGQRELQLGHLDGARLSFNRALETLLGSPVGARGEPRIRQHFDNLVERISAYEVTALAQGDGFTEKIYEPAAIDKILAESTFGAPATSQTTDAVTQDLESFSHDIGIPLNARVLSFVELFRGRLKGYIEEGLGRGARYLPMIQDIFRAEGLPLDLAYVPLIESAFKTNALSRARAKGLWQFMAGTGRENGLRQDWYVDERAEPEKATRAAAKYLKTLYGMFGDWHLALASYNGGPGRVQRAIARSGRRDFWTLTDSTRYLPRETRDYVPLILAAVIVAKNPTQYGLDVAPVDAPAVETIALPGPTDLRRVAEWTDTSVELLQELNPELRRWTTPVKAAEYELRVPAGAGERVAARLTDAGDGGLVNLSWYTVRRGETLTSIAGKLKVSRADLAEANYLSVRARVTSGQELIIPRAPTAILASRPDVALASASGRVDAVVAASNAVPAPTVYRVRPGDTLYAIARRFDVTIAELRAWNNIRGSVIQAGQRLRITPAAAAATR